MNYLHLILTAVIAFAVTSLLGIVVIPFLRKLKYGQTILDIGPRWHKNKQGTPTMGGVMFVVGITVAAIAGYAYCIMNNPQYREPQHMMGNAKFMLGLIMAFLYGCVGFLDDYVKVVKKQNEGLSAGQKMLFQLLIGVGYLAALYITGDVSTVVIIPFLGQIDFGLLYYPIMLFIIVGVVNAVNLTDGIDGLASSVTLVAALGFMCISAMLSAWQMNLLATALAGGCMGFLLWNFYPARVFMGDTGSLFLGGLVVALAFGLNMPVILVLIGIIYLVETMSVILQVASFKSTGKRIFKMSPIHHHFEMCGWSEVKIVAVFSLVTALGSGLAVLSVTMM